MAERRTTRTNPAKLAALRQAKGWSLVELARQSDLAYSHIRGANKGTRHLGKHAAAAVARALGCVVDDFTDPVDAPEDDHREPERAA